MKKISENMRAEFDKVWRMIYRNSKTFYELEDVIAVHISGSKYKKDNFVKLLERQRKDDALCLELGVIDKEEYNYCTYVADCMEKSLKTYEIY